MSDIVFFIEILISLGAISGAFLLSDKLRRVYNLPLLNAQFFYVTLIIFFAFVDIWGMVFFNRITSDFNLLPEYRLKITEFISYLGFPFLVIGWYMFIRFSMQVYRREIGTWSNIIYALLLLLLFFLIRIFMHGFDSDNYSYLTGRLNPVIFAFLLIDILVHMFGILNILLTSKKVEVHLVSAAWKNYAYLQLILVTIKVITAILVFVWPFMVHLMVVLFFLGIALPVLLVYRIMDVLVKTTFYQDIMNLDENNLFIKNGITKREKEIIEAICAGMTNQEIADRLFITLQTVKDHTHRIYLKMDVKNRMQLISLINSHKNVTK